MELHLIRHTETVGGEGRAIGHTDLDLSADHLLRFEDVRARLPDVVQRIVSSPSSRCSRLAKHLGERMAIAPAIDERLRELHFGVWEGQPWDAIDPMALHEWMTDFVHVKAGGGECFVELIARVGAFIDSLPRDSPEVILVVCHAGTVKAALTHVLGADPVRGYHVRVDHGSVTALKTLPGCAQWEVMRVNA